MTRAYHTWETDCGSLTRRFPRALLVLAIAGLLNACDGGASELGPGVGAVACTAGPAPAVLTWDTVKDATGYRIYYGITSGTYPQIVDVGPTTTYTVTTGLSSGTTYYFAATAYDSSIPPNESGFSNEVCKIIS